jgi:protein-S-isoprenylcysteine O-methyltransferase Ste14/uncharacterized membrane protein (UPF0127 family)
VIAQNLAVADTHWSRFRGLLGTKELAPGSGLWLRPCRQVHMIGMRYPLDIVFLDEAQRVVRVIPGLPPGRISPLVKAASSVIELPVGTVARIGLEEGAVVEVQGDVRPLRSGGALGPALCNLSLALLYALFVAAHVSVVHGSVDIAIIVQQAMLVVLFLARRRSTYTSERPFDWLLGIAGTFMPLLLRPQDPPGALFWVGQPLQFLGVTIAGIAVIFLGRSFGLVPANRGVKLGGAYRIVRHPMYSAYLLSYFGYVLSYPSIANVTLVLITVIVMNFRAIAEERVLARDPAYAAYLSRLRWRFVPYVY